jgi:hypothetical protein
MAKKETVGRVVRIRHETNMLLKQVLLDMEIRGYNKPREEIVEEIFELGVYTKAKLLRDEKSHES